MGSTPIRPRRQQARRCETAIAGAAKKVEAVYAYPYQNHATMEPMNTTVLYTADKCEAWCSTQSRRSGTCRASEAAVCRLPNAKSTRFRSAADSADAPPTTIVRQGVAIAKEVPGTPVKLLWSREEDMTHGRYHPVTQAKMVGAFDANNNLTALHHADFRPVNPRHRRSARLQNGKDPCVFRASTPVGQKARSATRSRTC